MTTREALRSAVAEIIWYSRDPLGYGTPWEHATKHERQPAYATAERVLRAAVETLGEPVAWMIVKTYESDGAVERYAEAAKPGTERKAREDVEYLNAKGFDIRSAVLVPLVPLSALLDSVEPATDE